MSTSAIERQPHLPGVPAIAMESPPGSSPDALTETGSNTPTHGPSSPSATKSSQLSQVAFTNSTQQLNAKPSAPKRKRTTAEEKEKERAEKKQKQDEAAAEKARIAAEKEAIKASKAAEKAAKAVEKAEKEAARVAKAAEKAKADAEKEAKKQKKQEEELAAQAKKEKQKNLLASFLKKAPTEPSKTSDRPNVTSKDDATSYSSKQGVESSKSAYDLNFKPFFVKSGVTMAPVQFEMDSETKEAKSAILDEYIRGDRGVFTVNHPFDAAKTFDLPFPRKRGIIPPSVKKIMETIHGDSYQNAFGLSNTRNELQTEKLLVNAQDQLGAVPMKYIRFYEDVRPAYFGTITTPMTHHKLRRLCRRPAGKILPLAYDYDSEAEWVEDDGEDLDDPEDEEEDVDGEEEMDDFVDDSEAIPAIIRPGFEADSLPVSTGLCFENSERLGPSTMVCKYRLEFLLDSPGPRSTIDPFSTEYWPAPLKKATLLATASSTHGTITGMLPPTTSRDVVATPDLKDGVPQNILEEFKRTLLSDECNEYSKATVIEMLAKKFSSCTKAQVKVTLDTIAHRVTPADAAKKSVKRWALLPGFSLK